MENIRPYEKRWFLTTIWISAILFIVYFAAHFFCKGDEQIYLTKDQLGAVNAIITDSVQEDEAINREKVLSYISTIIFINVSDSAKAARTAIIRNDLKQFRNSELSIILPSYPFKIESFFWLTGSSVFVELIFWSLFGVSASILYRVSEAMSEDNFESEKIPIHIAKIFYAPLSTVVIFLSIEIFSQDGSIVLEDVSSSAIVMAFILGFYSGRTVELLRRLKDVLLPLGSGGSATDRQSRELPLSGGLNGRIALPSSVDTSVDPANFMTAAIWLISVEDASLYYVTKADTEGRFAFKRIPQGEFQLKAEYSYGKDVYGLTIPITLTAKEENIHLMLESLTGKVFRFANVL